MGAEQSQMQGGAGGPGPATASQRPAASEPYEEEEEEEEEQMPELTAVKCSRTSTAIPTEQDWNYLNTANKIRALSNGTTFFTFGCKVGSLMSDKERLLIDLIINLSTFEDEAKSNNVPFVNIMDDEEASQYSVILVKTAYMLPNTDISQFTPEFLATPTYHTCCEPGSPVVWDDAPDKTTFRLTKTVIPYVYDLTIQMKVSAVTGIHLERLCSVDGRMPDHCLLLERTKRNPTVVDATRKCKSVLMYYSVPGGVLCTNLTAVLNTSLPSFIVPFIDGLGYYGSKEAAETATLTRAFLRKKNASAMPPRDALPEQSAGNVSVYQDAVPSVANGQPAEAAPATTTQAAKGEAGSDDEDVFVDAETDNEDDKA